MHNFMWNQVRSRPFLPSTKIKSVFGSKFTLLIVPPKERLLSNRHPPRQTGENFCFRFFSRILLDPTPEKKMVNLELPHVGVHEWHPGTALCPRLKLLPVSRPGQLLPYSENNHRSRQTNSVRHLCSPISESQKVGIRCRIIEYNLLMYKQCCGSGSGIGAFLTPGSGIRNRFFPVPGSRPDLGSRIPNPYF